MKYAILLIVFLILLFIVIIFLMKNSVSSNSLNFKELSNKEPLDINKNPSFSVSLLDFNKAKRNLFRTDTNDLLNFKIGKNRRIKVCNKNKYIGSIAVKDYQDFYLIYTNPTYFEGYLISKPDYNNYLKKATIKVQVKEQYSKAVYLLNNDYLNKYVSLDSLFEVNQEIETNYGPCKIVEMKKDHLIVEVPSLGKREIYDLKDVIKGN